MKPTTRKKPRAREIGELDRAPCASANIDEATHLALATFIDATNPVL